MSKLKHRDYRKSEREKKEKERERKREREREREREIECEERSKAPILWRLKGAQFDETLPLLPSPLISLSLSSSSLYLFSPSPFS